MILSSVLDYSLRALVLAAAAGVAILIFRRRTAAFEHAIWTGVAIAMLLMPLTPTLHSAHRTFPAPHLLAPPTVQEMVATRTAVIRSDEPPRTVIYHDATPLRDALYLLGVFACLARLVFGAALTRRALAGAQSIRGEPAIRAIATDLTIAIEENPRISAPLTAGLVSRRVVLPTSAQATTRAAVVRGGMDWRDWPASKLACVLAHEFAHIKRFDTFISFITALTTGHLLVPSACLVDETPHRPPRRGRRR